MQALSTFKNLFIFFIIIILLTCFGCIGGSGGDSSTEKPSWTIMVYMAADNDLSNYAKVDLQELEIGCNDNDNIKILVLIDQDSDGDTRLYKIKHDLYPWTIVSERLSDSTFLNISATGNDELDMSNPNTLSNFIKFCQANYPSENYALILWNHGGGWRNRMPATIKSNNIDSLKKYVTANKALPIYIKNKNTTPLKAVCWDDTTGFNESLTMSEVKQAVSGKGLTVIGFDACLMGMVEVAYQLKDCAQYMIASEETIPGDGWAYHLFLNSFKNTNQSPVDFGKSVIDTYIDDNSGSDNANAVTLSLIDLSKIDNLASAINTLSSAMQTGNIEQITAGRHKTLSFSVPHFVDLYHLAQNLSSFSGANDVIQALKEAVVYHKYLDDTGLYGFANSHGLSIYFPINNDYDPEYSDYKISNIDFAQTQWDDQLINYFNNVIKHTIETFPNSGGNDTDTYIVLFYDNNGTLTYLYEDDDSSNTGTGYYSKIVTPLASGEQYYILCLDYSILVNENGGGSSNNEPDPNAFEPDNDYNNAKEIQYGVVSDRYITERDYDWMYFIMP
jgi:hypothetical protein